MAITVSLQALLEGKQVASSKLSSKLVDELMTEGLLIVDAHGSKKSYRARNIEALQQYLMDKDESYRVLEVNSASSRASMATKTGNSKLVTVRSCPGFPVNSYEPIECQLDNEPFSVNPMKGCFLFVTEWEKFTIPNDITVIGIENMENFRLPERQTAVWEQILDQFGGDGVPPLLLVSRYPQSRDLVTWLQGIPNFYVHFGDFDLAGVHIYLTEFYRYLGAERSAFFVPSDLEQRLATSGSRERYQVQFERFGKMDVPDSRLLPLVLLLHRHQKGYDQEGYITGSENYE